MIPSETSQKTAQDCIKYLKTQDISLIKKYKIGDIEKALFEYRRDKGYETYDSMEFVLNKMKEKKKNIEKWKDRLIGSIITIIVTLILYFFTKYFNF